MTTPPPSRAAHLREEVRAQRTATVRLLGGLTDEQWDAPSLCRGWSVAHVAAHLTMPFRVRLPRLVLEVLRARGSIDRAADRLARAELAALGRDGVVATLRENVDHPWQPPGGGPTGALAHDVIHGLDITDALGLRPVAPPGRIAVVVEGVRDRLGYFGAELAGRRLVATDADVVVGQGPPVELPVDQVLLVCTGRRSVAEAVARTTGDRR
ncbi:maleylpyruvate isomerase family mycothiol-dependent enzyme [uncultured Georgenia sp.]|uniref:maleylpyruvate isomerase family mycothiol-dependent enzyme n=1 Tax=uncultured Georgenia sp. TaxID=378209 RepID=UPI0026023F10|nr:maleylpyruvate isomerase family mycothiol-dependent enzyme [uncultured Georgenia sp.]